MSLKFSEEQLADILYLYGELKNSRRIASAIIKARSTEPITTVEGLLSAVFHTAFKIARAHEVFYKSVFERVVGDDGKTSARLQNLNRNASRSAEWYVNNFSEEQLADILYLYGELKNSRRIAS